MAILLPPVLWAASLNHLTQTATAKSLQSCPTLCDPIDGSPPGSPRPWDSPGKNTGVGCHFLLQCMKVKSEREVAQSWLTLSDPMDCSLSGSSIHGIFQARVLEWGAIAFSMTQTINHVVSQPYCDDLPSQIIRISLVIYLFTFGCARSQLWHVEYSCGM